MLKHKKCIFFVLVLPLCLIAGALWYFHAAQIVRLDYEGFTVWLDCTKRGAVQFRYVPVQDTGKIPREHQFSIDPKVPARCQQTSTLAYKHAVVQYDRGHLVPANHMDHSAVAIRQSNYVTNIVPQVAEMNRGAWLRTEEIIECHRDKRKLLVIGGVIWGNYKKDDYFLKSHGIATPNAFWKIILAEKDVIAWIVPNIADATRTALDGYIVSVVDIERSIKKTISDVPAFLKHVRPQKSWPNPTTCDRR